MSLQVLSGFRDFYPEECRLREHIFPAWRESALAFGFSQIDGPPLEPLDLYKKKSGAEIVNQLYHFIDKGEREVALRPEMTPTLARMVGARHRDYKKPIKWFAIPQLFRYERAQRGRLREHFQWNCDILGELGTGCEVELLAVLDMALRKLGLGTQDYVFRISDRFFWQEFLEKHQVPAEKHYEFFQVIDKIERQKPAETQALLGELADPVLAAIEKGEGNARLNEVLERCAAMGLADVVKVDLRIVRGLAYYTGVVFEVHDRQGEMRAIAGGGRYDGLVKVIAGEDLPAVGFGMGDVVLAEMLKDRGLLPKPSGQDSYYVIVADEAQRNGALQLVSRLRQAGSRVDYPLAPAKIGKQFQAAEDLGYSHAVIVGHEFLTEGVCGLKHLASREQKTVRPEYKDGVFAGWIPVGC
jgi:histidyl-tRNA synthetase